MTSDFHKEVKAWSRIKHQILYGYVSLFLNKLGRTNQSVYYVDGFAGQGRYEDGTPGSALIAAEIALNPKMVSRKGQLKCINVEEDHKTLKNLEEATTNHIAQGIVTNLSGSFHDNLDNILQIVDGSPTFFFLDPFGTMGVETSTLAKISKLRGAKEVLVRYDDTRVKRLVAWGKQNETYLSPRVRKTINSLAKRVSQLTDERAIELLQTSESETREELIAGYQRKVKKEARFKYSIQLSYPRSS
jgi:three-Cys-motif partner protein